MQKEMFEIDKINEYFRTFVILLLLIAFLSLFFCLEDCKQKKKNEKLNCN